MTTKFKVGDKVRYASSWSNHRGRPSQVGTVTKIAKTRVLVVREDGKRGYVDPENIWKVEE